MSRTEGSAGLVRFSSQMGPWRGSDARGPCARAYDERRQEMTGRIPTRVLTLAVAILATSALSMIGAGAASAKVVYDNIPKTLPANFASIGFAATATSELGGEVELTNTSAKKPEDLPVSAVMSSWACQSGGWNEDNCVTTPGATFAWPITLKIYSVGALGEPVGPIAEETQTFNI